MKRQHEVKLSMVVFGTLVAMNSLALLGSAAKELGENQTVAPKIEITVVPPKGAGPDRLDRIAGSVTGADIRECKVVIFALGGNTWYVQPYTASPYTSINDAGRWENDTHLGSEYVALLVKPSYNPPDTMIAFPDVAGTVLAIARVAARVQSVPPSDAAAKPDLSNEVRTLQFSGYEWKVKSSNGPVGPGPNHFSDSKCNVEVDAQGRLHLRLTHHDGHWYCSEVVSTRSFGYGTYKFYVDGSIDSIDPNIVLGLFTWSDAPAFSHREIDVEISRWGNKDNKNGQFVVQPYTRPMNIVRFQIPPGLSASTHSFSWKADSILCRSLKGIDATSPGKSSVIAEHAFTQDIPQAGGENARMNLWLLAGHAPTDGKEMEIVVSKFEFVPWRQ